VLRVTTDPSGRGHAFYHGSTLHGRQDMAPPYRREPLTYYHRGGPVDDVLRAFPGGLRAVAVAGLGTGTMAAYSRPGQRWTFFEIDPMVAEVARNPTLFTFLRDAPAEVEVVLGDARLALAKVHDASYDLLVLDAFSSDAVPVHLLTVEALDLYLRKLRSNGLLVFNVSNRYVDLAPQLGSLGAQRGVAVIARDDRIDPERRRRGWLSSYWVAMGRESSPPLALLRAMAEWQPVGAGPRPWTDDYASLVSVLRAW
jgi:SAM-dependent methyltransferase